MSKDKELYQDPIREKIIGFIENTYEQKANILNAIIILAIVIGGISIMRKTSTDNVNEANAAFGIAQNSYINGLQDFALIEFKDISENYSGENAGYMAELYIAAEAFSNGEFDDADSRLKAISGKFEVDEINANVVGMRADIALSQGNNEEALKLYEDASKSCSFENYKLKFNIGKLYALQANGEHSKVIEIASELLDGEISNNVVRNSIEELKAFSQHYTM